MCGNGSGDVSSQRFESYKLVLTQALTLSLTLRCLSNVMGRPNPDSDSELTLSVAACSAWQLSRIVTLTLSFSESAVQP